MTDPSTTPEQRFAVLVATLLAVPGVTYGTEQKRGFGSNTLKVNGSIFAMLVRDALVADGSGECFDPRRDGRQMKEWLVLDPASDADWLALLYEAFAFVGSAR